MGNPFQATSIVAGYQATYVVGPGTPIAAAENPAISAVNPAAAPVNSGTSLQVFAIGLDNALWTTWQGGNLTWVDWQRIGGSFSRLGRFLPLIANPPVPFAINTSGNVEFASGADQIPYNWNITNLGGVVSNLVVGQNVEVFGIGTDHAIWHNWQNSNGNWSGWQSLGGWAANLDEGTNFLGGQEVFVIGANNNISHIWQSAPRSNWSGWENLGGGAVNLAVGTNFMNGLEVFIIGTDNSFSHIWQDKKGNWSGWENLGGQSGQARKLAVSQIKAYPGLVVFIIGTDNAVWHNWQNRSYNWSGWQSLGGGAKDLTVQVNALGGLEVFIIGTDNVVYHNWQTQSLGNWSGWYSLVGGS